MTALLTRLANMRTDLNIWFDRLSNWQFVAVAAPITFCIIVVTDYAVTLATGYGNVSLNISFDLAFTVIFTAFMAWRRWK
jgi:hypothetical protein